jgi:hypothetical protein
MFYPIISNLITVHLTTVTGWVQATIDAVAAYFSINSAKTLFSY